MTRLCIFLILVCVAGCQQIATHETATTLDPELRRLTSELDAAKTQTDMNLASKKLSEFWDAKLASVERRVEQKLDVEKQKQFSDSKERWRSYRMHEVEFRSGLFAGGSIQPLIANMSYSHITEHRVVELETILADALEAHQ